ncbi:hypothetical protein [Algoriphagus taiwanensis]|uniref:hypothetical protein n=1 Tax=Algoriphagus taiwanensis TaxID=1445656 RepID=UPI0030C72922
MGVWKVLTWPGLTNSVDYIIAAKGTMWALDETKAFGSDLPAHPSPNFYLLLFLYPIQKKK